MFWLRRHHVLLRALFGTVVLETKTQVCRVWVLMLGHLLLGFLSNSQLLLLSMCIFLLLFLTHAFLCLWWLAMSSCTCLPKYIFTLQFCVPMDTRTCMCGCTHVEMRRQLAGVGSLYHVVPWDQTQIFSFGGKHFHALSPLTGPFISMWAVSLPCLLHPNTGKLAPQACLL